MVHIRGISTVKLYGKGMFTAYLSWNSDIDSDSIASLTHLKHEVADMETDISMFTNIFVLISVCDWSSCIFNAYIYSN